MTFRFHLPERLVSGGLLGALLTLALTRSPLWQHLVPPVQDLLPSRYAAVVEILPGDANTALAFLLLVAVAALGFLLPRQPLLIPAAVTAVVLAYATYPWGLIHWHRLIIDIPLADGPPGALDWILFALPVVLLLAIPALLNIRAVVARYRAKGVPRSDLPPIEKHLARATLQGAGTALAVAAVLGILLHLAASRLPTTGLLIANSIVVLLIVTGLLVAALAVGTGALSPSKDDPKKA